MCILKFGKANAEPLPVDCVHLNVIFVLSKCTYFENAGFK